MNIVNKHFCFSLLLILFVVCIVPSCMKEIREPHKTDKNQVVPKVTKASSDICIDDSLLILSRYQSDHDVIMLNNIIMEENGKLRLIISQSEAESIGISNEVFKKYYDYVYTDIQNI